MAGVAEDFCLMIVGAITGAKALACGACAGMAKDGAGAGAKVWDGLAATVDMTWLGGGVTISSDGSATGAAWGRAAPARCFILPGLSLVLSFRSSLSDVTTESSVSKSPPLPSLLPGCGLRRAQTVG